MLCFMASSVLLLSLLALLFIVEPARAASCSSQTFSDKRVFELCDNLPHLKSSIHWTYNASASSLHVAFLAPAPDPAGWVSWAINPTGKGMVGAQALIAFRQSNGSAAVQTFNISAYGPVHPSPISFPVSGLEGLFSADNNLFTIFAMFTLPINTSTVNQVWQVGSSVTNGIPNKHAFAPENLKAFSALDLVKGTVSQNTNTTTNSTTSTGGLKPNATASGANSTSSSLNVLPSSSVSFSSLIIGILTIFWSV